MGLNDSPIYRASQDLTQTLLNIARLNQYKRQMDMEEQELQRKAGIETEDRTREALAREKVERLFEGVGRMPIEAAPPGPLTGGAPLVSSLQDASTMNTTPKGLDFAGLLGAMVKSKGAGIAADPQFAQILHAGEIMKSPEQVKLEAQQADRERRSKGVALALQDRYPNKTIEELLEIASAVPVGDADAWGRLPIHQQQADTGSRGMDLRWADANLNTRKSQFNADIADRRVKSFAENIESLIQERAAMRPDKQEALRAGADANRARAAKTIEETKFVGTSKAGEPTVRDQDVEAYMRHFAGMSDDDVSAAIDDAPATVQGKMRQAKQALFDQRRQQILGGRGPGATSQTTTKKVLRFDNQGNLLR